MKSKITLKLDASLMLEAKLLAAEQASSISALLTTTLEELVSQRRNYEAARKRALARLKHGYDLGFTPAESRDELHHGKV